MNAIPAHDYGAKLGRLLSLRASSALRDLVLPIVPVAALPHDADSASAAPGERLARYRAALRAARPDLGAEVAAVCGPAPWIVRSSGLEDLEANVNAGGYESLVCAASQDLIDCVAQVALSGWREFARQQQAVAGHAETPEPIACFVQPLLDVAVAADVDPDQSPWLDDSTLSRIESLATEMMQVFGFDGIDCEWGLQTDKGFVSVTSMLPQDTDTVHGAHTIGFGFASAQNTADRPTSMALNLAGTTLRLWRGAHLRQATLRQLWLLQARPARLDRACREHSVLTAACRSALAGAYDSAPAALLLLGERQAGAQLLAPDLATAWRRYVALGVQERAAIAAVLVDEGSAEEHAGIMFRQQRVTCIKLDTRKVSHGTRAVVLDRGSCFFGEAAMLHTLQTELRVEMVLPGDCALVFGDASFDPSGRLLDACARGLASLRALPLDEEVAAALSARSEYPAPDLWIQTDAHGVESPSLFAQTLRRRGGPVHARVPEYAETYARASQLARGSTPPGVVLPSLTGAAGDLKPLAGSSDLRIAVALLACEQEASWVPQPLLRLLVETALRQLQAGSGPSVQRLLSLPTAIRHEADCLQIYDQNECAEHLGTIVRALADGLAPNAFAAIEALELPAPATAMLADAVRASPVLIEPVLQLRLALAHFRGGASSVAAVAASARLNASFAAFATALVDSGAPAAVAALVKGSLVEAYDASLKGLLSQVVAEADRAAYFRYLGVMTEWIAFCRTHAGARDLFVFGRFETWLAEWATEPLPESFDIDDRNWRLEFDRIAAAGAAAPRYENPHVLHNLLHQWLLAGTGLNILLMPRRLRELQRFCSSFSLRSTEVLRFERGLFEIQIPMGTHKASFVFTPQRISVEWTEPPNCGDDEIARVLAFEVLLQRYHDWMYGGLTVRRERVLGTWTLFIRVEADPAKGWRWTDHRRFVAAVRFLFDASYDFSYVKNEAVDGFDDHVAAPAWKSVFDTLIDYRSVLDVEGQYVALHTLPMSTTVGAMAQSAVVRGLLLRCYRGGGDACLGIIESYAYWLDHGTDSVRWRRRYELLRQACLMLAAAWPRAALAALAVRQRFHVGHDLVAASLFRRADLREDILRRVAGVAPALEGLYGLVLRHLPELVATLPVSRPLVQQLIRARGSFRRARNLVVSWGAQDIEEDELLQLVEHAGALPFARSAEGEQRLDEAMQHTGPRLRFALERGVVWATLDAQRASAHRLAQEEV